MQIRYQFIREHINCVYKALENTLCARNCKHLFILYFVFIFWNNVYAQNQAKHGRKYFCACEVILIRLLVPIGITVPWDFFSLYSIRWNVLISWTRSFFLHYSIFFISLFMLVVYAVHFIILLSSQQWLMGYLWNKIKQNNRLPSVFALLTFQCRLSAHKTVAWCGAACFGILFFLCNVYTWKSLASIIFYFINIDI